MDWTVEYVLSIQYQVNTLFKLLRDCLNIVDNIIFHKVENSTAAAVDYSKRCVVYSIGNMFRKFKKLHLLAKNILQESFVPSFLSKKKSVTETLYATKCTKKSPCCANIPKQICIGTYRMIRMNGKNFRLLKSKSDALKKGRTWLISQKSTVAWKSLNSCQSIWITLY